MNTEDAITHALRARANAVPHSPMPRLGRTQESRTQERRRSWLAPVAAAAVVVVAAAAAVFTLSQGKDDTTTPAAPPAALAPGEVYYSLRLTNIHTGDMLQETQLWQPSARDGEWRQTVVQGPTLRDGRVVPGPGRVEALPGGVCYPGFRKGDENCTAPGSWFSPTIDFLATAPRDPATIADQLHAKAIDVLGRNGQSADLAPALELHYIGVLLASNGVPAELAGALRQVTIGLPGVQVTENMANLAGERGTGYTFTAPKNTPVTVIFDADGHYLGSPNEAVHHGIAPALGAPPSRMLD